MLAPLFIPQKIQPRIEQNGSVLSFESGEWRPFVAFLPLFCPGVADALTTVDDAALQSAGRSDPHESGEVPAMGWRGVQGLSRAAPCRVAVRFGIAAVLALSVVVGAVAQDFRSGLSAFRTSDYATALKHWQPLARRGDAKSQAALGYMYFNGIGVPRDYALAAEWYRRAAMQNQIDALHSLGSMYLNGYGVARDLVRAYVLCEMALAQGEAQGLYCRDSAEHSMSDAQLRQARRHLSEWNAIAGKSWLTN